MFLPQVGAIGVSELGIKFNLIFQLRLLRS